jgi:hypothetical protein
MDEREVHCARCGTPLQQGASCVQFTRGVVGVTTIVALATSTYCSDACLRAALSPNAPIRTARRRVP